MLNAISKGSGFTAARNGGNDVMAKIRRDNIACSWVSSNADMELTCSLVDELDIN